ncbi:hypothetical protein B0H16DRAFT_1520739, partial [Mycena metata]
MPHQLKTRIQGIKACLVSALALFDDLNKAFAPPFIEAIGKSTEVLIDGIQNLKSKREECFQLVERIHQVLYAIIDLHIKSETVGSLPPSIVDHTERFMGTLQKICTYIGAHQKGNRIKQFFRQSEMNALLKDCHSGLDQAMQVFKVQPGYTVFNSVIEIQKKEQDMHNDLLELVAMLSDSTVSDRSSSILYGGVNGSQNSSTSFCMLPSKPKIFHGRESELADIIQLLAQDSPRLAILGGGGMGKTSLARAVLHYSDICAKFQERFFVSAEATTTAHQLATLIGLHLGLEPNGDLRTVVHIFADKENPCLLVLDNLETPWEPRESRRGVEDFLSLLADVKHLALIITMRGSERPGKVQWTRPFLLPLQPLSDGAAQKTFDDITDDSHDSEEKIQLLRFTENMPLAVDLMAHLVDYEGLSNVLTRWQVEKTAVLSVGHTRNSNLDASITISFSSPRITAGAKQLLSVLAVLPDGLSDIELMQINILIPGIHSCKSALLATSLAYKDTSGRLRSLVPIREHIHQFYPPPLSLIHSVRKCFHELLACYGNHIDKLGNIMTQITANLANLDDMLRQGLCPESAELFSTGRFNISLSSFYRLTRMSQTPLLQHDLAQPFDHRLQVLHLIEHLWQPEAPIQDLISQGISHFQNLNDPTLESRFYLAAGTATLSSEPNHRSRALQFLEKALALARSSDGNGEADALTAIAYVKWCNEDHLAALALSRNAQSLAHRTGSLLQEVRALGQIAMCFTSLGRYQASITNIRRGRALFNDYGLFGGYFDRWIMMNLAEVHLQISEFAEARNLYATAIQNCSLDLDPMFHGVALLNIANIDVIIGATEFDIRENVHKAKIIFASLNMFAEVAYCEIVSADLMLREGEISSASLLYRKHLHLAWGVDSQLVSRCLVGLCQCSAQEAHSNSNWPVVYLAFAQTVKARLALHKALLFMGDFLLASHEEETAETLFTIALQGFTFMDVHFSRAQCMMRLGELASRNGDLVKAAELWTSARPLFKCSSQLNEVAQIDSKIEEASKSSTTGNQQDEGTASLPGFEGRTGTSTTNH